MDHGKSCYDRQLESLNAMYTNAAPAYKAHEIFLCARPNTSSMELF